MLPSLAHGDLSRGLTGQLADCIVYSLRRDVNLNTIPWPKLFRPVMNHAPEEQSQLYPI